MTDSAPSQLSGPQRAAIFLLGVGEEGAAAIMRHMVPAEVQQVGEAMASLSDVSNEQIASVLEEFSEKAGKISPIGIGASDFTRRVMVEALGENRARNVLNKVMQGGSSKGVEALKWMDARSVAGIIKNEHPQIVALVLASLPEEQAAKVLALLPEEGRSDLVMRIARLDMVDPAALEELDRVLEHQLATSDDAPPASVDGLTLAAGILNNLESGQDSQVLETVKTNDFDLAEKIENLMFVFENLMSLDDRGMQRLIREISGDSLLMALKGVDDEMKEKFFKNMSSRAAEMLKDDMEAKGPVKLSDVEAEQKQILTIAKKLADDGEIFIGKGGGDFV